MPIWAPPCKSYVHAFTAAKLCTLLCNDLYAAVVSDTYKISLVCGCWNAVHVSNTMCGSQAHKAETTFAVVICRNYDPSEDQREPVSPFERLKDDANKAFALKRYPQAIAK